MTLRPTRKFDKIPVEVPTLFRPLATNSAGGKIALINGWHTRPVLRPGTRVCVEGEGFQAYIKPGTTAGDSGSFILIDYPVAPSRDATMGLKVRSWTNTRIVADLPLDPVLEYGATNDMRVSLIVWAHGPDGISTSLRVPRIRFLV